MTNIKIKLSSLQTSCATITDIDILRLMYLWVHECTEHLAEYRNVDIRWVVNHHILLTSTKTTITSCLLQDDIDFIWVSDSQDRSTPENMISEFLTGGRIHTRSEYQKRKCYSHLQGTCTLLFRASNLPRTFWPYVLRHFLLLRTCWPTDR
jgi:hypothetical protein